MPSHLHDSSRPAPGSGPTRTEPDRQLQWGRGLTTAEMSASVASRSCGFHLLQWGRGLTTAEMSEIDAITNKVISELQWGPGLTTAEIRRDPRVLRDGRRASMGPRSHSRGNRARSRSRGDPLFASMGPRSHDRGNWSSAYRRCAGVRMLQWGRGLTTAEIAPPASSHRISVSRADREQRYPGATFSPPRGACRVRKCGTDNAFGCVEWGCVRVRSLRRSMWPGIRIRGGRAPRAPCRGARGTGTRGAPGPHKDPD